MGFLGLIIKKIHDNLIKSYNFLRDGPSKKNTHKISYDLCFNR